jgi:hypothetical protein
MKQADTYKEIKIIQCGNITARVHIPDITEEERNRRMKEISEAAGQLLASQEIKK